MTDREKLMNMIRIGCACPGNRDPFGEHCEDCYYFDSKECDVERLADHLIANGVTFAKDTNVPSWIPVSERLPEPFELVYVYVPKEKSATNAYMTRHKEWVGVRMNCEVTHWMPLPEQPKEE